MKRYESWCDVNAVLSLLASFILICQWSLLASSAEKLAALPSESMRSSRRVLFSYAIQLVAVYVKAESSVLHGHEYNEYCTFGLRGFDDVFRKQFIDLGNLEFSNLRVYPMLSLVDWCWVYFKQLVAVLCNVDVAKVTIPHLCKLEQYVDVWFLDSIILGGYRDFFAPTLLQ